ncbi:OmpA family protein [Solitalea canadensis]|uniref:Outer membrane protein/peptidoglycan-associated (Lipo)protein n=1 Tax=Solitalea canadensis (strain ATCC 29591 / DSM 3403 / JCM 21819 / LMG 8368 / NBRC 15130 / NCIMB 12057 / USAM 9D) TaxID=929556 RepID=H8KTD1_SOLCM|nr:OmpA family protein [Solitalea canadensis]AFD06268.1 outer membrane protein/peptidoglycan-associated (lipo)protein [Solitalea canadensis DSM 3403]
MISLLKKPKSIFFLLTLFTVVFLLNSCNSTKNHKTTPDTYIKKYMDKEAFEIQRAVKDSKVERVGDSIKVTFTNEIFFDHNQYTLKPQAESSVKKLVIILKKYSKTYNIIQGHTDDTGNDDYNLSLSYKRAEEVKHFLSLNGIEEKRMNAYGVGDTQPVASNNNEEGKAKNRRVVIWITVDYGLKEEAEARTQ